MTTLRHRTKDDTSIGFVAWCIAIVVNFSPFKGGASASTTNDDGEDRRRCSEEQHCLGQIDGSDAILLPSCWNDNCELVQMNDCR